MKPEKAKTPTAREQSPAGLARNLRALRQARGWTQGELAQRVGVHLTHINRIELGRTVPGVDFALKAARSLGVTVDTLLSEDAGAPDVRIQDKDLAERLRLLDGLDQAKRTALLEVMDSMLTEQRMRHLLEQKPARHEQKAVHAG